jgi:alpha-tubulin suppressor-like RCC1 family protein
MPEFRKNVFSVNDVYKLAVKGEYDTFFNTPAEAPGALWGWGRNNAGMLGTPTCMINRSSPVQLPGDKWTCSSSGLEFTVAKKSDNTLWAWGTNAQAQLGQNCLRSYSSPVQVPGTEWNRIHAPFYAVFATKKDGTLWSWGDNTDGTLGQGLSAACCQNRCSPAQVGGTGWKCASASLHHVMGIKDDGTLWSWGRGGLGQLGLGDTLHRSSPVQLQGNEWTCAVTGCNMSFALKSDCTLWSWGDNGAGNIGHQDTILRCTPVQIPGNNWCNISSGFFFGHAIKTDGTLWGWGQNYSPGSGGGWLGDGTTISRCSPVQIPGNQWVQVCSMEFASIAIKSDSTVWVWGRNLCGQLGIGDTINRSSPVQLPGAWSWIQRPGPVDFFAKKVN